MADGTRTTLANAMFELQAKVQEVFATETPWLGLLSGVGDASKVGRFTRDMDSNRDVFHGSNVRGPIVPYGLQGAGSVSETGTWNVPHALEVGAYTLSLKDYLVPFSISVDVERDTQNPDTAAMTALALHVKQARQALAKVENITMHGDGTGLIVDITDGATSLATTCGTTANFDILLPGTTWDILTRSTGADPGQGLRRKIASVVESTRVITWSTTAQASDGGSGNIVHTSADGIYVPGSYGTVAQGLAQAAAITGTFEGIVKGTVPYWNGTDGRGGTTTTAALSDELLDAAVRRGRRFGNGTWDFGIGDPSAIDLYKQGKNPQVRYDKSSTEVKSGFQGIVYEGADKPFPLYRDPHATKGTVRLIIKSDFQLYGDKVGPKFLEDDGGFFRRFSRTLAKEADLLDRVQLGVRNCNSIVFINNLASAS